MNKEKRAAEKRAARNHKEDVVLNRVLVWFGAAVVAELLLLLLNRYYINRTTRPGEIEFAAALYHAFPIIIGVTAAATVVCLVWAVLRVQKGKGYLLPSVLAWICGALLVISTVTYLFNAAGVSFLCGLVPAAAVMALVYYLYQREFFVITVLSAIGIVGLWLIRRAAGGHQAVVYAYLVVGAVVIIAVALACREEQRQISGMARLQEPLLQCLGQRLRAGAADKAAGGDGIAVVHQQRRLLGGKHANFFHA